MFLTYERGTRMLFAAAKQVLSQQGLEGVSPSSTDHRKMLSPQGFEGDLPSSSEKQEHIGQHNKDKGKGKGKLQEVDPNDEKERDFDLVVHEEV